MKYLVETNGHYSLHDMIGRQTVQAFRPTVVERTSFIDSQRGDKLTVLEELADDASDAPLAAARTYEELEAAIEALPRPERKKPEPKTEEKVEAPVKTPAKPKGK